MSRPGAEPAGSGPVLPARPGSPDGWTSALIAVTGGSAAVASFVFLTTLARQTGWPSWAAPLLPLTVDALAAMALRVYLIARRRAAAAVAVGAIAASMAGNAASHWFATGLLVPGWAAITLVGAVPAVSLGLVVHLAAGTGTERRTRTEVPAWDPEPAAVSSATTSPPPRMATAGAAPIATPPAGGRTAAPGTSRSSRRSEADWQRLLEKARQIPEPRTYKTLTSQLRISRRDVPEVLRRLDTVNGSPR